MVKRFLDQDPEKKDEDEDEDYDEDEDDEEFRGGSGGPTGQVGERRSTRRSAQNLEEPAPSKKMKIDEEQQVRELLQGSARYDAGS